MAGRLAVEDSLMKDCIQHRRQASSKFCSLKLDDTVSLVLYEGAEPAQGDSSCLQKGLVLFHEARPLCGEGVGFGVPAVEYLDQALFSTFASVQAANGVLVKSFWIDASPRMTWARFSIDSRPYFAIQRRLDNMYRTDRRFRLLLTYAMKLQPLLGVKSSFQKINPRGFVEVRYHLLGRNVSIEVDSSKLSDTNFKRLLIFNEQSASFDLYNDGLETLGKEDIGAWEEVKSERACLKNEKSNVTFCVEKISGTKLYRGRELLRPHLDWAGFCYSIPAYQQRFNYTIQIT